MTFPCNIDLETGCNLIYSPEGLITGVNVRFTDGSYTIAPVYGKIPTINVPTANISDVILQLFTEIRQNGFACLNMFPDRTYTYTQEILDKAINIILDTEEYKIIYLVVDPNDNLDDKARMRFKFLVGAGLSIPDLRRKLFPTI